MCYQDQLSENQMTFSKSLRLAKFLIAHKGCSINVSQGHPICGYMVSVIAGPVYQPDSAVDLSDLAYWCRENYHNDCYFGSWEDEKTGLLHIDISEQFYNLHAAMQVARDHNQIAIWDVVNNCEIRLK